MRQRDIAGMRGKLITFEWVVGIYEEFAALVFGLSMKKRWMSRRRWWRSCIKFHHRRKGGWNLLQGDTGREKREVSNVKVKGCKVLQYFHTQHEKKKEGKIYWNFKSIYYGFECSCEFDRGVWGDMLSEVWLNESLQGVDVFCIQDFRGLHGWNFLRLFFFIHAEEASRNRRNDPHCTLSRKQVSVIQSFVYIRDSWDCTTKGILVTWKTSLATDRWNTKREQRT